MPKLFLSKAYPLPSSKSVFFKVYQVQTVSSRAYPKLLHLPSLFCTGYNQPQGKAVIKDIEVSFSLAKFDDEADLGDKEGEPKRDCHLGVSDVQFS